jgi:hypothetical protein
MVQNLNKGRDNDALSKQLEEELLWNAKVLAFRIGLLFNHFISQGDEGSRDIKSAMVQYAEGKEKNALSGDRKFLGLMNIVRSDLDDAYSELDHSNEQHLTHL